MEVRLLDSDGWGRPMDAYEGLSSPMRRVHEIDAVSGIFTGGETAAARVELYRDGRVLAGDRLDAERWPVVAHDLVDDC